MNIGATFPQDELAHDPAALGRFATTTEALGFSHLVMYDHVVGAVRVDDRERPVPSRAYDETSPFHDPFVAFGYLAGITEQIELVTGVIILPQRQTVLVARQAADVALLSGNRLRLGIGVGYNPVEFQALGEQFSKRGRKMTEQIPYLRQLWAGGPVTFDGDFHTIDRAALNPVPQEPIPLWHGGFSDAAFRRAARFADGFIFGYAYRHDAIEQWLRVQELLAEEGRSTDGFRAVFNLLPHEPGLGLERTVDAILRLRDAGATDVTLTSVRRGMRTVQEHLDYLGEVQDVTQAAL